MSAPSRNPLLAALAFSLTLLPVSVRGETIVLDFEGLQDLEQVLEFYNGGTGSLGSAGPNLGVSFGDSALAIIDQDAGGSGNFANEPSPSTIAFFLSGGDLIMNVPGGFDTGFSFFYSSSVAASVTVFDALDGGGNILASVPLAAQGTAAQGCNLPGDPTGAFACWSPAGVAFAGLAFSASFAGVADQTGFDDITLGSATPGDGDGNGTPVPEPATLLLLGSGLVAAGARRYRRTR